MNPRRIMLDLSSERDELDSLGNEKVETLEQQLETLPDELMPQHLQLSSPSATTAMPKSAHSLEGATVEDHAAMKKQWQTNLEIDLLKSAWIRKDREQHGAHTAPPLSAAK
ncbi:hypothetical protein JG688_00004609 [Phytophthora aleatoria]|uniref:Uncharacterized protein n=1 Tax=Phytophthora aleatoria TaxID=2496075 RepID=A0A8J5ISU6_9STRA|nr:hypothetical protein JG688_00004609 [Phytophthora aleatoria]